MSTTSGSQKPINIPVPSSLSATSPQLPALTSEVFVAHLRGDTNTVSDLSQTLSDAFARTGWTDRVRALSQELLRSGKCESFPELFEEVMRRVKEDGHPGSSKSDEPQSKTGGKTIPGATNNHKDKDKDGTATPTNMNGSGAIAVREGWFGPDGLPDVRVPMAAVEAGCDFLKGKVKHVVEVVDEEEED